MLIFSRDSRVKGLTSNWILGLLWATVAALAMAARPNDPPALAADDPADPTEPPPPPPPPCFESGALIAAALAVGEASGGILEDECVGTS